MKIKKVLSAALAAAVLVSVFSGCAGNKKGKQRKVTSECGYFTSEKIEFEVPYDDDGVHMVASCDCKSHCVVGDSVFVIVDALVGNPNDTDEETIQYADIIEYSITDGSIKNVFEGDKLKEAFAGTQASLLQIASLHEENGRVKVFVYESSGMSGYCLDSAILDAESGTLTEIKRYEDILFDPMGYLQPGYTSNPVVKVDNRYVFPVYDFSLSPAGIPGAYYVFDENGCLGSIDCKELEMTDIYETRQTYNIVTKGGTTCLEGCYYSYSNGRVDFELNLDTLTATAVTESTDNSTEGEADEHYAFAVNDSLNMSVDNDGIYLLNSDSGLWEQKVDFNYADVNLADMAISTPIYYEDGLILVEPFSSDGRLSIIKLSASEEKPYEKRKDLTLASIYDDMDFATAEAIRMFNLENQDYHISVRFYDYNKEVSGIAALSGVSNMVLADMASGDAPDIILNAASMHEFNYSCYLLDLSSYLENENYINSSCFTSIVDAAYPGEEIFQLPISFKIAGIKTVASANSDYSFDFEEYAEYVSTKCNGTDPIATAVEGDRMDYFINLLRGDMDLFINYDSKTADFDTPEFRTVAEFVLNSYAVSDYAADYTDIYALLMNRAPDDEYGEFDLQYCMDENARLGETLHISGTPSISGRGPMARITASAAISADCDEADGAWSFIKYLYSEISNIPNTSYYAGLSRETSETTAQYIIDERNATIERETIFMGSTFVGGSVEENLAMMGLFTLSEDQIPSIMDNLNAIDRVDCFDTDIMEIFYEEMPAYFESQKTLDEVIEIINNRTSLILNERG